MKIVLSAPRSDWAELFHEESRRLGQVLALTQLNARFEHVGSTAVPGLVAKPIIDFMIGVNYFAENAENIVSLLSTAGYEYFPEFESRIPTRRFLRRISYNQAFNLHLVEYEGSFWRSHCLFRNRLRQSEDARRRYEVLKLALAQKEWASPSDYSDAKTDFIEKELAVISHEFINKGQFATR